MNTTAQRPAPTRRGMLAVLLALTLALSALAPPTARAQQMEGPRVVAADGTAAELDGSIDRRGGPLRSSADGQAINR